MQAKSLFTIDLNGQAFDPAAFEEMIRYPDLDRDPVSITAEGVDYWFDRFPNAPISQTARNFAPSCTYLTKEVAEDQLIWKSYFSQPATISATKYLHPDVQKHVWGSPTYKNDLPLEVVLNLGLMPGPTHTELMVRVNVLHALDAFCRNGRPVGLRIKSEKFPGNPVVMCRFFFETYYPDFIMEYGLPKPGERRMRMVMYTFDSASRLLGVHTIASRDNDEPNMWGRDLFCQDIINRYMNLRKEVWMKAYDSISNYGTVHFMFETQPDYKSFTLQMKYSLATQVDFWYRYKKSYTKTDQFIANAISRSGSPSLVLPFSVVMGNPTHHLNLEFERKPGLKYNVTLGRSILTFVLVMQRSGYVMHDNEGLKGVFIPVIQGSYIENWVSVTRYSRFKQAYPIDRYDTTGLLVVGDDRKLYPQVKNTKSSAQVVDNDTDSEMESGDETYPDSPVY